MLDFHGDRFVRQQVQREMEGDGEAMDRVRDELLERANHPDVWGGMELLEHLEGARSTLMFGPLDGFAPDNRSGGGDGLGTVASSVAPEEYVRTLRLLRDTIHAGD